MDEAQNDLKRFTERMREHDEYVRTMVEEVNALQKSSKEAELKKDQLKKDLQDMKKNVEDCTKRVSCLRCNNLSHWNWTECS